MEYQELERMTESHECAQCGAPLVIVHAEGSEAWLLKCGTDKTHTGVRKHESTKTALARGKGDKALGSGVQKDYEAAIERDAGKYSLMVRKDVGSGNVITVPQYGNLVTWAHSIGLNAYLGHVCLYYGEPYVTIDGYYYLLEQRKTDVKVGTRPLTKQEHEDYQIPEDDHAWIAEAWLGTTKMPTTGLGIITQEELNAPSKKDPGQFRAPIAHDKPQRMAEKRAEWQLLRKIVPLKETEPAGSGEGGKQ
jgi:hypothetical protein